MKPITYRPYIWPDILAAAKWYERQQAVLGGEFVEEIDQLFDKIQNSPHQFPVVWEKYGVRRCLLERFPYAIYFIERPADSLVISVIHSKRSPRVWKRRAR